MDISSINTYYSIIISVIIYIIITIIISQWLMKTNKKLLFNPD